MHILDSVEFFTFTAILELTKKKKKIANLVHNVKCMCQEVCDRCTRKDMCLSVCALLRREGCDGGSALRSATEVETVEGCSGIGGR